VEEKGFTRTEIKKLVLNAIEMSWTSEEKKRGLITRFENDPVWSG
jgi:adenosine deaminase